MPVFSKEKLKSFFANRWVKRALIAMAALFVLLIIGLVVVYSYVAGKVPSEEALRNIQNHTASEVYSADGVLLGKYFSFSLSILFSVIAL